MRCTPIAHSSRLWLTQTVQFLYNENVLQSSLTKKGGGRGKFHKNFGCLSSAGVLCRVREIRRPSSEDRSGNPGRSGRRDCSDKFRIGYRCKGCLHGSS